MLSSIRFWPGRFAKTLARYMLLLLSTLWGCALVTVFFIMLCVCACSVSLFCIALRCVASQNPQSRWDEKRATIDWMESFILLNYGNRGGFDWEKWGRIRDTPVGGYQHLSMHYLAGLPTFVIINHLLFTAILWICTCAWNMIYQ